MGALALVSKSENAGATSLQQGFGASFPAPLVDGKASLPAPKIGGSAWSPRLTTN